MMPPGLAAQFTVGERAVLYVIARQVKLRAHNAQRAAKQLGLILIDERRLSARTTGKSTLRVLFTAARFRLRQEFEPDPQRGQRNHEFCTVTNVLGFAPCRTRST